MPRREAQLALKLMDLSRIGRRIIQCALSIKVSLCCPLKMDEILRRINCAKPSGKQLKIRIVLKTNPLRSKLTSLLLMRSPLPKLEILRQTLLVNQYSGIVIVGHH